MSSARETARDELPAEDNIRIKHYIAWRAEEAAAQAAEAATRNADNLSRELGRVGTETERAADEILRSIAERGVLRNAADALEAAIATLGAIHARSGTTHTDRLNTLRDAVDELTIEIRTDICPRCGAVEDQSTGCDCDD